jgi:hypothetical protein
MERGERRLHFRLNRNSKGLPGPKVSSPNFQTLYFLSFQQRAGKESAHSERSKAKLGSRKDLLNGSSNRTQKRRKAISRPLFSLQNSLLLGFEA